MLKQSLLAGKKLMLTKTTRKELANGRQVKVTTSKNGSLLQTRASVFAIDGNFEVHRVLRDYSKVLFEEPCVRVTRRKIDAQHDLVDWDELSTRVSRFYANIASSTEVNGTLTGKPSSTVVAMTVVCT